MIRRAPLLVLLVAGLFAEPAGAGSISISISPTIEVRDQTLNVLVGVRNSGDEAAQSVAALLVFRDEQVRGDVRPSLGPQETMQAALSLPIGDLDNGRWPFRVAVDYTDANQYPFQALHVGVVGLGNPPAPKLAVAEVKGGSLAASGTLRVRLKNLAGVERKLRVSVAAPEGIEVTTPPEEVSLAAWGEIQVTHALVNRTALAGSRYPLFVTAEYDDDGVHQAVIGSGVIDIHARQSFFQTWRTAFWFGAGAFVAIWLGFLLWRAAAPRHRRAETRT